MPRWQLKENRIEQILKLHGLEVRMWDVEDGVFLGAIVDGQRPEIFNQPSVEDGSAGSCG